MIDKRCLLPNARSKIKLEEGARSATFDNPKGKSGIVPIKVDGCVEIEGKKCDFAVEYEGGAVLVELKGRDVEGAAKQIEATASLWLHDMKRCDRVAGLIVAKQFPRRNSTIQLKQAKFAKKFAAPLHVVCQNSEYIFENLFSFRNPLRGK